MAPPSPLGKRYMEEEHDENAASGALSLVAETTVIQSAGKEGTEIS